MGRVQLTKTAAADLQAIWDYIDKNNTDAADRLLRSLREHFNLLSDNMKLGRLRPEVAPELRCFPVKNYLVFYRTIQGGIEIVRVVHGSRNLHALFDPEES